MLKAFLSATAHRIAFMMAEVGAAPLPSLTRRLIKLASGAMPMYWPALALPSPAMMPATAVPWP